MRNEKSVAWIASHTKINPDLYNYQSLPTNKKILSMTTVERSVVYALQPLVVTEVTNIFPFPSRLTERTWPAPLLLKKKIELSELVHY